MAQAKQSVYEAQLRASMIGGVRHDRASGARRRGQETAPGSGLKVSHFSAKEISVLAEEYFAQHGAELLNEAAIVVERLRVEGYLGKRAQAVRNPPQLPRHAHAECSQSSTNTNTCQTPIERTRGNSTMSDAAPSAANRTLRRLPNAAYRQREYLTEPEVERLIEAARRRGRNGARDAAAILLAYPHGLRAAELCQLRWSQIDLRHGRLHVQPSKGRDRKRASSARP